MTNSLPDYDGEDVVADKRRKRLDDDQLHEANEANDQNAKGDQPAAQAGDAAPTALNTRARRRGQTSARKKTQKRELTPPDAPVDITLARSELASANAMQANDAASETAATEATLLELEAQGFTEDEALRLLIVSGRLAGSREARESQATLRRLRFTRWLIDRGILDEFSA